MLRQFTAVMLMAIVTYLPRALPIVLVKSKLNSRFIKSFLYYVPFAVLGAMTFPSILSSTQNTWSATIGMLVAVVLSYFEKTLLTVAISAIITVYVCELLI